jgi:TRAP-type mannitol/chloroaromatic compound transport system substrate-binding protein
MERRCSLLPFLMGLVVIGILLTGLACRRPQEAAAPAPPPAPPAAAPAPAPAAPAAPAAAPAPKPIVWKGQSSYAAVDELHKSLVAFAKKVEEMSGGRLKMEVYPGGALVPPFETLDATHKGVLDFSLGDGDYWVPKHPAGSLFASAPAYGMNQWELLTWVYYGGGLELYREYIHNLLGYTNVEVFFLNPAYAQPLGWFKRPIRTMADLRGLRFRAPGLPAEVMRELGVPVVVVPAPEVVPAMERGVIDAAEYFSPTSDKLLGLHDVAKYYHMPSYLQPIGLVQNLFINKAKWEELPPDLKAIIKYAAMAEAADFFMRYLTKNSEDLVELVEKHGVTIVNTSPEILKSLLEGWDKVWAKYSKDPFFAKVLESQKAWAKRLLLLRQNINPPVEIAIEHYRLFEKR